jgi:prepilin-type N-terminal cleavage/methylation domain-containing protein
MQRVELMPSSYRKHAGVTLIEVMVALAITSVSVIGLMSLQPQSLNMMARADFTGRAAGILHSELEQAELLILNPAFDAASIDQNDRSVASGNLTYTVKTTVVFLGSLFYKVTVNVKWPGNEAGITGCRRVTRQEGFRTS